VENENKSNLTKKYGLLTATCMIVGTVIGSGIFFKSEEMARAIGGRIELGILAWVIGGLIMLGLVYTFSVLATRHEKCNGLVDYADAVVGKKYGYMLGWFLAVIFWPSITGILAFVSARFSLILVGFAPATAGFQPETFMLAGLYIVAVHAMNYISPKIGGKFQISATVIKIIPLILMAIAGLIVGLVNGTTVSNVEIGLLPSAVDSPPFYLALVATAFAFAGWDAPFTMNSEIKNSKRNLPIAMVGGGIIIVIIYLAYYIGMFGAAPAGVMAGGGTRIGFENVFGNAMGTILYVFVIISCLGTLNGCTMGAQRGLYSLAIRKKGPAPEIMSQVDSKTNVPGNSATIGLMLSVAWLFAFGGHQAGWWTLPLSNLVVILHSAMLIPVLIGMMIKQKDLKWWNRYLAPAVTVIGVSFMVYALADILKMTLVWFMVVVAIIMVVGVLFYIPAQCYKAALAKMGIKCKT